MKHPQKDIPITVFRAGGKKAEGLSAYPSRVVTVICSLSASIDPKSRKKSAWGTGGCQGKGWPDVASLELGPFHLTAFVCCRMRIMFLMLLFGQDLKFHLLQNSTCRVAFLLHARNSSPCSALNS